MRFKRTANMILYEQKPFYHPLGWVCVENK